jgi:hypothetical protein
MVSKLSNRVSYFLTALGILIIIAIGINALTPGQKPNPGHWINETSPPDPCTANQFLQFDGTNWKCVANTQWIRSGNNIYANITTSGRVGIGTASPLSKLEVNGSQRIIYDGTGNSDPGILIGNLISSPVRWAQIYYDASDTNSLFAIITSTNGSLYFNGSDIGISTQAPDAKLQVNGDLHAATFISDDLVQGSKGKFQTLDAANINFNELSINKSQFSMKSTNGDNCIISLSSNRITGQPSGTGSLSITCYAPLNVCGNGILEPSNGEQCEPPGSTKQFTNLTGPTWNCQAGNPHLNDWAYVFVPCTSTCQFSSSVSCICQAYCFDSQTKTHCNIDYNCFTETPEQTCINGCRTR